MSKISVTTIAGLTSGGDANKVKIESGDTLQVESNATVGGTLGVTGTTTTAAITSTGRHDVNFNGSGTQAFKYTDTGGGNLASFGQFYNPSNALIANIQNANNDGIHLNIKNGSIVFSNVGYTPANALDDYEEGTYTPALASSGCTFSYSVQLGSYVKVGNLVYLQFNISLSNRTGTTSNVVFLDNVPFLTKNVNNSLYSGGHIGHYFNVNLSAGTTMVYQLPAVSTNQIELKEVGDNMGENGLLASELGTNTVIRGSVVYRAAT